LRLAVLCDFLEEGWPSMDLAAASLVEALDRRGGPLTAHRFVPSYARTLARIPGIGRSRYALNVDRLANRLFRYPRELKGIVGQFDLFHVADHSYAHLVHHLPAARTGVYCHDLDAFRCLLQPALEPRPRWFRAIARRALSGLQRAALVFHSTWSVREQIKSFGIVEPDRLVLAPLGVSPEFGPDPEPGETLPGGLKGASYLLHVGSCIPRKRIDVLLESFALARSRAPTIRLVQIGGRWTSEQKALMNGLGIADAVLQMRNVERSVLARLYRGAAIVLQPSEAEGFGIPVVEALACGSVVIASDIPALREVGGNAVLIRPVGDARAWAQVIEDLLLDPGRAPSRAARLAQARRFSWDTHADAISQAYLRISSTQRGSR